MKEKTEKAFLTPEIVAPIVQGLLASGHYTVRVDDTPGFSTEAYDAGQQTSVAANDAIKIAADMLDAIERYNDEIE